MSRAANAIAILAGRFAYLAGNAFIHFRGVSSSANRLLKKPLPSVVVLMFCSAVVMSFSVWVSRPALVPSAPPLYHGLRAGVHKNRSSFFHAGQLARLQQLKTARWIRTTVQASLSYIVRSNGLYIARLTPAVLDGLVSLSAIIRLRAISCLRDSSKKKRRGGFEPPAEPRQGHALKRFGHCMTNPGSPLRLSFHVRLYPGSRHKLFA